LVRWTQAFSQSPEAAATTAFRNDSSAAGAMKPGFGTRSSACWRVTGSEGRAGGGAAFRGRDAVVRGFDVGRRVVGFVVVEVRREVLRERVVPPVESL